MYVWIVADPSLLVEAICTSYHHNIMYEHAVHAPAGISISPYDTNFIRSTAAVQILPTTHNSEVVPRAADPVACPLLAVLCGYTAVVAGKSSTAAAVHDEYTTQQ